MRLSVHHEVVIAGAMQTGSVLREARPVGVELGIHPFLLWRFRVSLRAPE